MKIKEKINHFKKIQTEIFDSIIKLREVFLSEETLWEKILKQDDIFFNDGKGMSFLADALQLVNIDERIKEFDLKDIENIYRLLVKFYPNDTQYKLDLISFLNNVMGNEDEAGLLIKELQNEIRKMDRELENIVSQMDGK